MNDLLNNEKRPSTVSDLYDTSTPLGLEIPYFKRLTFNSKYKIINFELDVKEQELLRNIKLINEYYGK